CTHSVATQLSDEGQRYRRISLTRMCHSFIAIVLQAFASGVCIVSAPVIARLLQMFSRSSLCDFIKYVLVRQVLKGHPNVTVRLGAVHGRECSFNCYQYSLQQRFLHDGCREGGICRLKSTRHYERFAFSQHRQAGHEVNRLCEAGRTDLLHQLGLRAHAFLPIQSSRVDRAAKSGGLEEARVETAVSRHHARPFGVDLLKQSLPPPGSWRRLPWRPLGSQHTRAPEPVLGQSVNDFRRETLRTIKRTFLPPSHELYKNNRRGPPADALNASQHNICPQHGICMSRKCARAFIVVPLILAYAIPFWIAKVCDAQSTDHPYHPG